MVCMRNALLCVALALVLAGCGELPAPVVRPTGGAVPAIATTVKPRKTRKPRPTETSAPTETPTLPVVPTHTPRPAPSLTPTLPFQVVNATPTLESVSATATRAGPSELECKLIWQSPPDGSVYFMGEKFSVGWDIQNIGTLTWDPGSFEFKYLGGARLATHDDVIPMQQSVPPGQEVVLSVPMKAPATASKYTTHWGIRQGDVYFCRLTLSITVQ